MKQAGILNKTKFISVLRLTIDGEYSAHISKYAMRRTTNNISEKNPFLKRKDKDLSHKIVIIASALIEK